jgi:hypothetical protein
MDETYMAAVLNLQQKLEVQGVEINAMILGGGEIVVDVPQASADEVANNLDLQRQRRWSTQYGGAWQGYDLIVRGYGKA